MKSFPAVPRFQNRQAKGPDVAAMDSDSVWRRSELGLPSLVSFLPHRKGRVFAFLPNWGGVVGHCLPADHLKEHRGGPGLQLLPCLLPGASQVCRNGQGTGEFRPSGKVSLYLDTPSEKGKRRHAHLFLA